MLRLRDITLRASLIGLCLATGACPSSDRPDAGASSDVTAPRDVSARRARRRRARRRARARPRATQSAHGASATPTPNSADELDEAPEAPRPRVNPESGPTLSEELGPPPAASFDMTRAAAGTVGLDPAQVRRALDPLVPRLVACAEYATRDDGDGPRGRFNVRLRVRPEGRPTAARLSGGHGSAEFTLCARRVLASARFSRFEGPDVFVTWGFDIDG